MKKLMIIMKKGPLYLFFLQEYEIQLLEEKGDYEVWTITKDFSKTLFDPYYPKANCMFKMLKKKNDIDTVFKKTKTLGSVLKHSSRAPTDKCKQQHIVYKVPCQCHKAYFGESKSKMGTKLKEHQSQCKLADRTNKVTKTHTTIQNSPTPQKQES